MPQAVIDASAVAAVAFGEDEGPAVAKRTAGADLVAPELLWFEMANICVVKARRHPEETDDLLASLADARDMPVRIHEVDPVAVAALALETELSGYDASYLWLARHLNCELVSLDRKLSAAAE